ncbi:MAG: L,D-transpeptidase, partial [Pararhizobium sp.]
MMLKRSLTALIVATVAAGLASGTANAQQVVGYGPQGPIVLVTPDGRILDRLPEYGSVSVYYDRQGRRVLVDDRGDLVATEMPLNVVRREGLPGISGFPDQFRGGPVQQYGLPPADDRNRASLDNPDLETGTIPSQGGGTANDSLGAAPLPDPVGGGALLQQIPSDMSSKAHKADIAAVEVLLDRAGISPGVIDGRIGGNVEKALATYQRQTGKRLDPKNTAAVRAQLQQTGGPAFTTYTITPEDAAGPYVASIPTDYSKKAELDRLGYTSTAEMLAERFHMDEDYLKALNPGVDFSVPGSEIKVVNPGANVQGAVAYIIADKGHAQVRGYDADHRLLVAYPATIGSTDTPSPSGTVTVERIARNPEYTYNPKINFTQGNNKKILRIPPGPNGPVGNMWIALS